MPYFRGRIEQNEADSDTGRVIACPDPLILTNPFPLGATLATMAA